MTPTTCPYGPADCPKIAEMEDRIDRLEGHLSSIYGLLWGIMGGVLASLIGIMGVLII